MPVVDPQLKIALMRAFFVIALGLHISGVNELPPVVFWVLLAGFLLMCVHDLRMRFDANYREKRDAGMAQLRANVREGKTTLTMNQVRLISAAALLFSAGPLVHQVIRGDGSWPGLAASLALVSVSAFASHRFFMRKTRGSGDV
jgi:hypothetical protein